MKVALASSSIFRAKLLELAGVEYEVRVPHIDETVITGTKLPPAEVVRSLAAQKAISVWDKNDGVMILGADTIAVVDNEILGHPKNKDDARRMLRMLSGKQHDIFTGVHICSDYVELSFSERTIVKMYKLSDEDIEGYLSFNEYHNRPGAYDISRRGSLLIESISGDYNNILGLPIGLLIRQLRSCGFRM